MQHFSNKFIVLTVSTILSSAIAMPESFAAGHAAAKGGGKVKNTHSIEEAIKGGTVNIEGRYRFENVDQSNLASDAEASTLRTKLGYTTGKYKGVSAGLEFENIAHVGDTDFNDTVNGKTAFPVVADPKDTAVNQAFIAWENGIPETTIKIGRQILNIDNQRFVGSVNWRQNDQTLDALVINNTSVKDTSFTYAYVERINRIFGSDSAVGHFDTNSHIINASYSGLPYGKLTAYSYLLDIDDAPAISSSTYGARFAGHINPEKDFKIPYVFEYAAQSDYGDNPVNYDADYYAIESGVSWKNLTVKGGYEVLGSDNGVAAFQTPLATLHKFNGWADQFLVTPATGLEDLYASVNYKVEGVNEYVDGLNLTAVYHDFSADEGGADYGSEWNLSASKKFYKYFNAGVKYANFDSDGGAVASNDVEKLIFTLGFKYSL